MDVKEREQLIQMVREIQNTSACVTDFDGMMNRLEEKLGNREIGRLIFDPPSGKRLTAEEIVEIATGKNDSADK